MKPSIARSALVATLLAAATSPQVLAADPVFRGPTPYLSFADSPFKPFFPSSFSYFHLDDFESAIRTPGYTVDAGVRLPLGTKTDSVDWDGPINGSNPATSLVAPGSINGSGTEGASWFSDGVTGVFTFTFNAALLDNKLPTHVGIVWTDVGDVNVIPGETPAGVGPGRTLVAMEAAGPGGMFGAFDYGLQGDGNPNGGTAEDVFLGVTSAGGISSITVYTFASVDWEVDHLQYGHMNPVPEPEQWLMMALGLGAVAWRLKRRQT